ncbi:MAG: FAD-dependent oxidoreductase [Eubacteriales bacterium]
MSEVQMSYDAIIVGGGMAGLTAAAFLSQSGRSVLLCEKEERVGGLVGSFTRDEFVFDAGIRALENSGVLFPMLRQLGIEMEFLDNPVSIGIGDKIVTIRSERDIAAYQRMLTDLFPEERENIAAIVDVVHRSMTYMDVLYGIDNPLFMDLKHDTAYLKETLLPWLFRYIAALGKIKRLSEPGGAVSGEDHTKPNADRHDRLSISSGKPPLRLR